MKHCPHCGCELTQSTGGKPRSVEQIRRYFALVKQAFLHWPEAHERQFSSAEELRKWLQMKAGWREVGAQIPLAGMSKERAMLLAEAAIRGAGSFAFPVIHGSTLVVFRPKSISFGTMPHAEFTRLTHEVEAVIERETGISVADLMRQESAA